MSLGVAATFRDEANALPGFLEMAAAFFDEILLVDCSMDLSPSSDGSLDIIRKWGITDPPRWSLADGFGSIRNQLVNTSRADWVVVMDIDERMRVTLPELTCAGSESYPNVKHPNLTVAARGAYNQRELLNAKICQADALGVKAIRFRRRHWFDASFQRPTQNWHDVPDWQLRCMKARSGVGFTTVPKMHERAWDAVEKRDPRYIEEESARGPFLDHYHCLFKPMERAQREADIAAYDALHHSETHTPIPK